MARFLPVLFLFACVPVRGGDGSGADLGNCSGILQNAIGFWWFEVAPPLSERVVSIEPYGADGWYVWIAGDEEGRSGAAWDGDPPCVIGLGDEVLLVIASAEPDEMEAGFGAADSVWFRTDADAWEAAHQR